MATAVIAVASSVAAGAAGSAVATSFGILGGVIAGAVVGGVVSAVGAAITGGDVGKAFLTGAITGAVAGGLAGWSKVSNMAKAADTTNVVQGDSSVIRDPALNIAETNTVVTNNSAVPSAKGGSVIGDSATTAKHWSKPPTNQFTPKTDVSGVVNNSSNASINPQTIDNISNKAVEAPGLLNKVGGGIKKTWNGMGDYGKMAAVQGTMQVGGGLLQGMGADKIAEENKAAEEEKRKRANNFFQKYDSSKFAITSYRSKYNEAAA